jgi:carboxypeptidase Taq
MRRKYDEDTKIPEELIKRETKQSTIASSAREKAKKKGNWSLFEAEFSKMLEIEMDYASRLMEIKEVSSPYDALLDYFQRGTRTKYLVSLFSDITQQATPLIRKYAEVSKETRTDFLDRSVDISIQKRIVNDLTKFVGYDTESENAIGRIGEGEHPFTTGLYDDVRIIVKYKEDRFLTAIMSFLHESGHALYNSNLRREWRYEPVGYHAGSAVQESQARLVENIIGRSSEFWRYFLPRLNKVANDLFADVTLQEFTKAVNPVNPQPVRVNADELTYSIHIIIRFEIERGLFAGDIQAAEIPVVWNELYEKYLGVEVKNDGEGALQDPHWALGMFGHFPMYTLGNIISAQLAESMERDVADWRAQITTGDASQVIQWMTERIHEVGLLYDLPALIMQATGEELSAVAYIKYLKEKYTTLYE